MLLSLCCISAQADTTYSGSASGSVDVMSGSKNNAKQNLDVKLVATGDTWTNTVTLTGQHASSDGDVKANNYQAEYNLRRFYGDHLYIDSRALYKIDTVEDLYQKRVIGSGGGWRFYNDDTGLFALGVLVNANDYTYTTKEEQFYTPSGTVDYQRKLAEKLTFATSMEMGVPIQAYTRYEFDGSTSLTYALTQSINASIKYTHYALRSTAGDVTQNDFTVNLGAKF
jgi:hypothetical protein